VADPGGAIRPCPPLENGGGQDRVWPPFGKNVAASGGKAPMKPHNKYPHLATTYTLNNKLTH